MNSICILFILVGLAGLKASPKAVQAPGNVGRPVPVSLVSIPNPPKTVVQTTKQESQGMPSSPFETPAPVSVAFAENGVELPLSVPMQVIADVALVPEYLQAAPTILPEAAGPVPFSPANAREGGFYPAPEYPPVAVRNRWQGTVNIYIAVSPDGQILDARVTRSSGHSSLDDAALEVVRSRWRFPSGARRALVWACVFQLR